MDNKEESELLGVLKELQSIEAEGEEPEVSQSELEERYQANQSKQDTAVQDWFLGLPAEKREAIVNALEGKTEAEVGTAMKSIDKQLQEATTPEETEKILESLTYKDPTTGQTMKGVNPLKRPEFSTQVRKPVKYSSDSLDAKLEAIAKEHAGDPLKIIEEQSKIADTMTATDSNGIKRNLSRFVPNNPEERHDIDSGELFSGFKKGVN